MAVFSQQAVDTPVEQVCARARVAQCNLLSYFRTMSYGRTIGCAGPERRNPILSTLKLSTWDSVDELAPPQAQVFANGN